MSKEKRKTIHRHGLEYLPKQEGLSTYSNDPLLHAADSDPINCPGIEHEKNIVSPLYIIV